MTVAGVFGLPHLSEDAVAAFADGVLSGAAASRARRHCAECAECAQAVQAQREAALLLRTAGSPTLPAGLLDRLAGVPMSTPLPPPCGGLPTMIGADGVPVLVAHDRQPDQDGDQTTDRDQTSHRQADAHQQVAARLPAGRRLLLPVGIFASAAAVLAAGAVGHTLSSVPHPVEQQPASVQLPGGRTPASPSPPTTGPGLAGAVVHSQSATSTSGTAPASLAGTRSRAGGR